MRVSLNCNIPLCLFNELQQGGKSCVSEYIQWLVHLFIRNDLDIEVVDIDKRLGKNVALSLDMKSFELIGKIAEALNIEISRVIACMIRNFTHDTASWLETMRTVSKPKHAHIEGTFVYVGLAKCSTGTFIKYGITTNLNSRMQSHKFTLRRANGMFAPVKAFRARSIHHAKACESQLKQRFPVVNTGLEACKTEVTYINYLQDVLSEVENFMNPIAN